MTGRGRVRLAASVAGLIVLAGCGGASNGTNELGAGLDRVDDAIVARDYDAARDALDDLESKTTSLADAGELSPVEKKALLAAVADLRTSLPADAPSPAQDPTTETPSPPPPPPTTTEPSDEGDDEGDSVGTPKSDKPDKERDKKDN